MKILKSIKLMASSLVVVSALTLNPTGVSAQWKQDNTGWWNTEGDSWSVGWKCINEEWYYFDNKGYMRTGWVQDSGKWYYLNSSGAMAKNTTIDGYILDSEGVWNQTVQNTSTQNNSPNLEKDKKTIDQNSSLSSDKNKNITTSDDSNFTIDQFISILKTKADSVKLENVAPDFLPTQRKRIAIDDDRIYVYVYNSNQAMEKDSLNIKSNGFSYSNGKRALMVSWVSAPHFYKKGNIIVQYVGRNEKTISYLKDILGEQFAGSKESTSTNEKELREIAYDQLTSAEKEIIEGTWKDSKLSRITLIEGMGNIVDKSYIGKEVYLINFPTKSKSKPNNIIVYMGIDSNKLIGHGYVD